MKILDAYWFNGGGIVRVATEYDGIKYYIKGIPTEQMTVEAIDAQHIADWGNTFPSAVGDALFGVDELRNGQAVPLPQNKEQAELMVRVGTFYLDSQA